MLSWLRTRQSKNASRSRGWELGTPLLTWSRHDVWSIRDAVEGTLVLGATGAGKSSGSGRSIAKAMLRSGFGGTVLVVKPDERALWEKYCSETGRLDDLMVLGPEDSLRFSFLDYELNRKGTGAGLTENIVNLFSTVLEVAERNAAGGGGREDEGYWKRANRQLCRNVVDLLALAKGRITVPDLYRAVISAPTSMEQVRSEDWKKNSDCLRWLGEADKRMKTPRQTEDFELVCDFFLVEWPSLSDKTRSVILSTFTSMLDVLNRGILRDLFCTSTNVVPEDAADGRIILVDLPVKTFAEVGQFAQVLWKYAFQRSIERRNIEENARPVFLWADEAQYFLTSYDMQFQTTCRAARVATVMLSQNVSNFYAALGGSEKGRSEAASLWANLNTKVFHANGDPVTNEWGSSLIGKSRQFLANGNSNYSADEMWAKRNGATLFGPAASSTTGFSEAFEFELQPSEFTRLRTGGPDNGWCVDGIVFQNGRVFRHSGKTHLRVTFSQK